MANYHRGEIEAELGGVKRTLVLTLGALAEIYGLQVAGDHMEVSLADYFAEQLGRRAKRGDIVVPVRTPFSLFPLLTGRLPVNVAERTLRENFLLPFQAAVEQGDVGSIMASYNEINGVPEALAREAFLLASAKLPLRTTFVARGGTYLTIWG